MFLSWLKSRRRRKLLAEPFPAHWETALQQNVGHDAVLQPRAQRRLRQIVSILLSEKVWEGCRGLELTDEIRVTIAALAGILILGFDDYYFDNVQTVLVYPSGFVATAQKVLADDVALQEESNRLGEAHRHGPVILSWAEVRENASHPGHGQNLVFHEFAHQLDMLNGELDGTPHLSSRQMAKRWREVMDPEYRRLQNARRHRRESVLDPYGATNPAEFFAVATESFFDHPRLMREAHPGLYELFRDYFRQDPALWSDFEEDWG